MKNSVLLSLGLVLFSISVHGRTLLRNQAETHLEIDAGEKESSIVNANKIKSMNQINEAHHNRVKRYAPSTNMTRKWPNGIVYYKIDENLSIIQDNIIQAMTEIENASCIQFIERTNETDYIYLQQVDDACFAPVGYQNNGPQDALIYLPECGFYSYLLHQLMQSLGFHHEHQRYDRDEYIVIQSENVHPDHLTYFAKLDEETHSRSEYDFESVMHYGSTRFSNNSLPTMLMRNGTLIKELQEKTRLSNLDVLGINQYYNCNRK